jgi:hypothetical protein
MSEACHAISSCHHLTQPWQFDSHTTRNTTRLKRSACHPKSRWTRPKCCACQEIWKSSSENDAKLLRLTGKRLSALFYTRDNVTKCDAVCHTQNDIQPVLKPSEMRGFAASPIGAMLEESQRIETARSLNPNTNPKNQHPRLRQLQVPFARPQHKARSVKRSCAKISLLDCLTRTPWERKSIAETRFSGSKKSRRISKTCMFQKFLWTKVTKQVTSKMFWFQVCKSLDLQTLKPIRSSR